MALTPPPVPPRPMAPPPTPGRPAVPMRPLPPGGGSPADRAAGAMADRNKAARDAVMAAMPPAPSGGWSTPKVVAVCTAVNAALDALGASAQKCAWVAPKGMPKMPQFPPEVFMKAVMLLTVIRQFMDPAKAAELHIDPSMFGSDAGLDQVARILGKLASDKALIAKIHAKAEAMASGHTEPDQDEGAAPAKPSDNDADNMDPSLAGSPPMAAGYRA